MELFRSLGSLIEPPSVESRRIAELLDLEPPPTHDQHTDLFLFQLYPYASVYLDGQGKLGGEARDRIAGFWRALDLEPPPEPDHLTVLLAFYGELQTRQAEAAAARRDRWRHVRGAFFWEQLMSWLPVYVDKVRDLDPPFYWGWADLLARALVDEAAEIPAPPQLPLHLRQAAPLNDPRRGDDGEFVESILSPIRSGFILVRRDLLRAGRDLQLGIRAGERAFALKALLGQNDKATLLWLAEEAGRWVDRHRSWGAATGLIADFWAARARTTADLLTDLAGDL